MQNIEQLRNNYLEVSKFNSWKHLSAYERLNITFYNISLNPIKKIKGKAKSIKKTGINGKYQ